MSSAWDGLENSMKKTELPHYAINKSVPDDAFYTKKEIAKHCMEVFETHITNLNEFTFIEPSAGEGRFYELLPEDKREGLDINPQAEGIHKADYLTYVPNKAGKIAVVGNPPFGHRGALAMAFMKRSFLFADLVAFILPMSFYSNGKGSNMKRTEEFATLVHSEKLPPNSFYWPETGKDMDVKTVFQIWKKGKGKSAFPEYDVSEYADIFTCCSSPNRYCGLGRGRNYDCFIASSFYDKVELVHDFEDVLYGSGYGIIIKKQKQEIMEILSNANWMQYCSDATSQCKHIRMHHIRKLLGDNGKGFEK